MWKGSLRCTLEKVEIVAKGLLIEIRTLKVILMRAQKEKRAGEQTSIFLEKKVNNPAQTVDRNTDVKGHSGKVEIRN